MRAAYRGLLRLAASIPAEGREGRANIAEVRSFAFFPCSPGKLPTCHLALTVVSDARAQAVRMTFQRREKKMPSRAVGRQPEVAAFTPDGFEKQEARTLIDPRSCTPVGEASAITQLVVDGFARKGKHRQDHDELAIVYALASGSGDFPGPASLSNWHAPLHASRREPALGARRGLNILQLGAASDAGHARLCAAGNRQYKEMLIAELRRRAIAQMSRDLNEADGSTVRERNML